MCFQKTCCVFSLTFLILLLFSVSELHSCGGGDTVPRKPCGTHSSHIKTVSTMLINVFYLNQSTPSLREHRDALPEPIVSKGVDEDKNVPLPNKVEILQHNVNILS